jgi:hypothetical protein
MEAVVMPFPTEETTPPVTKMYFGICSPLRALALVCGNRDLGRL